MKTKKVKGPNEGKEGARNGVCMFPVTTARTEPASPGDSKHQLVTPRNAQISNNNSKMII